MEQEDFGVKIMIQALFDGQRDMHAKLDNLYNFVQEHMENEEKQRIGMAVQLARLDEKVGSQGKKWGIVSTVITSILSALGVSFFVGHK